MGALGRAARPPYLRIAAELRDRIASGELRPGDRIPSTRGITREWGVAMATASKALAVLRQEGLVRAVPGVGTVVDAPGTESGAVRTRASRRGGRRRTAGPPLTRERVVRTAVAVADAHGSAALSMRAVATALGVSTTVLYRHVSAKDELVELMADAVFGDVALPAPAPADWRGRLEAWAWAQWALYRRHPWLVKALSFTRSPLPGNVSALMEWSVAPARDRGVDAGRARYAAVTVAGYVRGLAMGMEDEAPAGRDGRAAGFALDALFAFGLARMLDGLGTVAWYRG
ncbi:hypothetical protein BLA24_23715 [Streptomyces cinnamoneus]|uniref:Uncharacterized protein n=1 Tax=Streptomyces cinnamoneus TaxID=53446 RepID=A0A2G1XCZ8_STRCJ|nr:GntR family transcriptional regulator [Streptomyces cinnamoneus]PHQ49092.1 hypothetical protein BLA24_23715 [Streptomyces cinnamoneus]PPT15262.1 GntR family transcriptional regulator [Streptomyces cinnamoneus]